MAKMWGVSKTEKLTQQRKNFSARINIEIDKEITKKHYTPKLGVKASVMKIYIEKGKLAAWEALQEFNKKLTGQGFSLEMLEQWIGEYEKKQVQRAGIDDGYDR